MSSLCNLNCLRTTVQSIIYEMSKYYQDKCIYNHGLISSKSSLRKVKYAFTSLGLS